MKDRITAEGLIRWSTVAVVVAVAVGAAIVSYRHAYELVLAHGETGTTAVIAPLTVDGMIYASSMVLLLAARRGGYGRDLWLAYVGLGLGIVATVAANMAHGIAHGPVGAVVGAWPALALVISYETLMWIVRASRTDHDAPEPATESHDDQDVAEPEPLTLPEALARVVESDKDMTRMKIAELLGADRKTIGAIIRQARPSPNGVSEIHPEETMETA